MSEGGLNFFDLAKFVASKTKATRVVRFFPGADLRCMHDGLRSIAVENGVDPYELRPGEFLVFCNTARTMLKIYAPGNTIACTKSPDGRRLDLNVIKYIPRFFNGSEFNYDGALKEVLKQKTGKA
jgi:hypothetical protein